MALLSEFNGNLGRYKVIQTKDASYTLWSEFFNEHCHSLEGAAEETIFNYISPCKISTRIKDNSLAILEVGFGIGHGVLETFKIVSQQQTDNSLTYLAVEIDEALIKWAIKYQPDSPPRFPSLKALTKTTTYNYSYYFTSNNGHQLYILCGDATKSLPLFLQDHPLHFNAIYQDAFSPATTPSLWSQQWFKLLHRYSHSNVILTTYSCAAMVRTNLESAQWNIKKRLGFKKKRQSLIATKLDDVV